MKSEGRIEVLEERGDPRRKLINIRFFEISDYESENSGNDINLDLIQLNGILNLCLIKYISLNIEDSEIKTIKRNSKNNYISKK